MTFPRRLTPSDKERATIVQQRMTPGGALGVGSRHVRSGSRPAPSSQAAAGGGILSAATYGQNPTTTTLSGDYIRPTDWVDATIGDYAAAWDPATLFFLADGLYQIAVWANVDTTSGTHAMLTMDFNSSAIGDDAGRDTDIAFNGTAWLYCISPILDIAAGQKLFPIWQVDGAAVGTNVYGYIRLVRFAS